MTRRGPKVPPPGRSTSRWFLFLTFYHLLPVIWYLAVAGGLAPASFLLAGGLASLFSGDSDGFAFAAFLLAPALLAGLLFHLVAWLLAVLIGRLHSPLARTLSLLGIFGACLIAAMQPIFISGGHSSSQSYSLFGFVEILEKFRVPASYTIGYFTGLGLVLVALLIHQHLAARRPAISARVWLRRRRLHRRILVAGISILLLSIGWTHRTLLFVKPLADLGFPTAQYQLAMALKQQSIARRGRAGGYQDWLVRAAEQGHLGAAKELALHPRSREEKLRWLTVAAEGGMADAQYELYRELLKGTPGVESSRRATDWLRAAASNNQAEAQFELGYAHLAVNPALKLERNPAQARSWLEQAAHNGHGEALKALARRYETGADGFPRDPQRAIELYQQLADAYRTGSKGLKQDARLAADQLARGQRLAEREARLAADDPQVQAELGRELLHVAGGTPRIRAEGVKFLEQAANAGDAQLQYELGGIFLFGRNDQSIDLPRGRSWWAKSLAQNHVETMEHVATAYQDGRFGYPVDLLQSKALVSKLIDAYRDGAYGVDPDPAKLRRWSSELKYLDRRFELAGGNYQSPLDLQRKAEAGDPQAQYQLGWQMLVSDAQAQRHQGLQWIQRAADGGYAEAQYRLVTYFENQAGIMRSDPARGVALLTAAAQQNHLPAMGALALGYEKGRYDLPRDLEQAQQWYQRLLRAYDEGSYTGEIDERFIPFNRQRLVYVSKALESEIEKARRYEAATLLERQIIEVEDRFRQQYQEAVNALPRDDGTRAGKRKFRADVQQLLKQYNQLRDAEIARLKGGK
jgi:TPR repeat protein